MVQCNGPVTGRRKLFWTTQPDACGTTENCFGECGAPGLVSYIPLGRTDGGRTFRTNDYVRSLALNILLTDGRHEDVPCGYRPGARGGHWSDSFREDGITSGTNVRYLKPQKSVSDTVKIIQEYLRNSMQKLVRYGVATSVTVECTYAGGGVIDAVIIIFGTDGLTSRVGITGSRLENSWVWGIK